MTWQKTCCASESNLPVRVVFANRSGFDAPIGVVMALEERGSCLNIFRMANRGQISETFMNYEAKDLLRESSTSVRVVFANWSCFDAPIGVVLAWEERGSCLNIFWTANHDRISETFTNYEAKDLFASESNTSVRVVFSNRTGFYAPIGVVLAWEERRSCLNIFRTKNCGRISETFRNYEAKDLLRKSWSDLRNLHELRGKRLVAQVSQTRRFALYLRTGVVLMLQLESSWHWTSVDHLLTYSGRQIMIGSQKPSRITRQKTCLQVSQTRRFALYFRTELVFMLQLESSWHGKSVDHVLTYSGRKTAVGSQKPSRIMREKTCCASESNTSVHVVFANRSGFDAPIGVFLA
ncbi:uncharacterized protein G2W53_014368 [Senna tora]|uniref:Uncharacterized protein n=1 Tax=Senna tora TaxID=362788 RepID=A0A835C5K9_9FABA|nr:uncharacterized protein G2W53_014368 [Senna tora]